MNIQKLIIPLSNFDRDRSSVLDLGGPRIISATEVSIPIQLPLKCKYILEMNSREREIPRRTLDRVLTVFKLFKDSLILSKFVFIGTQPDYLPHYTHWIDSDRGVPLYRLNEDEETKFCKFWNEYIEVNPKNFAVFRFHLADYSAYSTDRFVDYVESLEYLFVPDSGEGEIAYKFRTRGSLILGRNKLPDKRRQIFSNLKNAYSLRSAIVHGRNNVNKLLRGRTWEDNLQPIRCYARDAIKFFFQAGCLDNATVRKKVMENLLIFKAKIQ